MSFTQQYDPAYLAEDKSRELVNVLAAFAVLETSFMILFFTSRIMNNTSKGWDVYLMIPAFLSNVGLIAVGSAMVQYGGAGRHMVALKPSTVVTGVKLNRAVEFIYTISICLPKLAILCLYARVFSTRCYRYAIYIVGLLIVLTYVTGVIAAIAICQPFSYMWDKTDPDGHCGDVPAAWRYISIPNLFTDVCTIVLPLYGVWHLQMKTIQKIGLSVTFLTGCVGIVTGVLRLVYFFQIDIHKDVTFQTPVLMSWSLVEPGVYFIAATLPSLRPLIRYCFKDAKFTLYNNLLDRCSRVFSMHKSTRASSENSTTERRFKPEITRTTTIKTGSALDSAGFVKIVDLNAYGSTKLQGCNIEHV